MLAKRVYPRLMHPWLLIRAGRLDQVVIEAGGSPATARLIVTGCEPASPDHIKDALAAASDASGQ